MLTSTFECTLSRFGVTKLNSAEKGSGGNVAPDSTKGPNWKKAVSCVLTDGTYILCPTAGYLTAVIATADATGPCTVIVYDGHSAAGRPVWADQSLGNHAHGGSIDIPVYCDRGITVVVAATTIGATIQWIPGARQ